MPISAWQFGRVVTAYVLVTVVAVQPSLLAQTHVVSPAELQKEVVATTRARQHNAETVSAFLSSTNLEKTLRSAHMDPTR
ncbi:MAG: hypothetical protein HY646_00565, partial [Acidobacteria bacterium]|nr:hypothetical protein [Acidobacteriota bacterium]